MRRLLVVAVLALASCIADDAEGIDHSGWPTAQQAVVAECSPFCRWRVRCAGAQTQLEACETACIASYCASADCALPPSGSDATIARCEHDMYINSQADVACVSESFTYSEECRAAAMPAQ